MLDFTVPGCDACGMSGRKSTRVAHLGGSIYDKLTFEVMINCLVFQRGLAIFDVVI
jgi:hypothetical protein